MTRRFLLLALGFASGLAAGFGCSSSTAVPACDGPEACAGRPCVDGKCAAPERSAGCSDAAPCLPGQTCSEGVCGPECAADDPCPATAVCSAGQCVDEDTPPALDPVPSDPVGTLELYESWPAETTLDSPLRDATDVWIEAIDAAESTLDFEHFYAISEDGTSLERVLAAIERALDRGIQVRFIVDRKFYDNGNQALPDALASQGVSLRIIDLGSVTDGVQHAKFFVVDGKRALFGSQNFDWRSLDHIFELGMRMDASPAATALAAVFEMDWAIAGGRDPGAASAAGPEVDGRAFPMTFAGTAVSVTPALSPKSLLPDGAAWDLPLILAAIDGAEERVRVQVMSYTTHNYDKSTFTDLDDALRAAADRGVKVELLVADWSKSKYKVAELQALQALPNFEVSFVAIPDASSGFVPYSRVVHAKYMTVDGERAWIGTSNWSGDYFFKSRNVGLMIEGGAAADALDVLFDSLWTSTYAERVDSNAEYEPRRYKN